jgi:hypothetical protein
MPWPMQTVRRALMSVLPLMLLCIMASALAPRGFMPSAGPDGFRLELCASGLDTASLAADADNPTAAALLKALKQAEKQRHGSEKADGSSACPFAGTGLADLPVLTMPQAPLASAVHAQPLPMGRIILARHHAARPPATGPPHLI